MASAIEFLPSSRPVRVGAQELDALDAEILGVFDRQHFITPDDVRGDYDSLDEAIRQRGWPTIGESLRHTVARGADR